MARVAFFTLNVARESFDQPQMRGFVERIEGILAQASAASGFIAFPPAMAVAKDDPALVWPAAKPPDREAAMTLSLWRDVASVFAFAYGGPHAEALQSRREWTIRPEWPSYALWWVADDALPTWRDAAERHQALHAHGPTAHAFDFRVPFDAEGRALAAVRKPLGLTPHARGQAQRAGQSHLGDQVGGALPQRTRERETPRG